MGHKATYVNGIIKILRAFFKYTNGEDYTDIAYEKVAWVREEKPVIKAFSAQDARQLLEYYDNKSYLSCRNRTIITMFLETGIRCKELIDMQPEDIKETIFLSTVRITRSGWFLSHRIWASNWQSIGCG